MYIILAPFVLFIFALLLIFVFIHDTILSIFFKDKVTFREFAEFSKRGF